MKSRTLITILTWNRLEEYTKATVASLLEHNKDTLPDMAFMDNGSIDKTVEWVKNKGYEVIRNETNEGIFMGTRRIWLEAAKRGYDFVLNVQNDFPCIAAIPFRDIEIFLDENDDTGFVRLNQKKKKPGRDVNKLTGKKLKYEKKQKCGNTVFIKHNHHFSFNPNLFKTSLIKHMVEKVEKTRERQIMERFHDFGLKAAKLESPCPCFKTYIRPRMKDWIH